MITLNELLLLTIIKLQLPLYPKRVPTDKWPHPFPVDDSDYSLVFLMEAPSTSCSSRFVVSRLCCCWFHIDE